MDRGHDLASWVPSLLTRARALLRLPGGPADSLSRAELPIAARAVEALHQGLVGDRVLARSETYDQPAHLGAYLLWWWPQTYAKTRAALELTALPPLQVAQGTRERSAQATREQAPPGPRVRVLDLGAGPAPAALAILDVLAERGLHGEALAIDASGPALAEARALATSRGAAGRASPFDPGAAAGNEPVERGPLRTQLADLAKGALAPEGGPFELIVAANVLSELPGDAAARARLFMALAERSLAPGGVLILLEPALRETGRALLELRDAVLAAGARSVATRSPGALSPGAFPPGALRALAPCLTQQPCPALLHPRDWCTAEQRWSPPDHVSKLARELGLHADASLSYAPLLLSREVPAAPPELFRVVGVPQPEKGKQRIFVCNDLGRVAAGRLDRDESPHNRAFAQLGRSDLVRLGGLTKKGDGLRVGRESTVERLSSSSPQADSSSLAPGAGLHGIVAQEARVSGATSAIDPDKAE